jgi:hypothetical protein
MDYASRVQSEKRGGDLALEPLGPLNHKCLSTRIIRETAKDRSRWDTKLVAAETIASRVQSRGGPGVLDRAKMLLHSRRDFSDVCEQAVGVRTIDGTNLFYCIQVGQSPPIEDQIVSSSHQGISKMRKQPDW